VFATIFLWDCSLLQTHLTTHLIKSGLHRCTVAKRAPNVFAKLQLSCQGLIADVLGQAFGTASCDGGTKPQGKKKHKWQKKIQEIQEWQKGQEGQDFQIDSNPSSSFFKLSRTEDRDRRRNATKQIKEKDIKRQLEKECCKLKKFK